jgi:hypothetical protein
MTERMIQGVFHVGRRQTMLGDMLHVSVWIVRQVPNDIDERHALVQATS